MLVGWPATYEAFQPKIRPRPADGVEAKRRTPWNVDRCQGGAIRGTGEQARRNGGDGVANAPRTGDDRPRRGEHLDEGIGAMPQVLGAAERRVGGTVELAGCGPGDDTSGIRGALLEPVVLRRALAVCHQLVDQPPEREQGRRDQRGTKDGEPQSK